MDMFCSGRSLKKKLFFNELKSEWNFHSLDQCFTTGDPEH